MKAIHAVLRLAALTPVFGLAATIPAVPASAAGMPVFDATNYAENLIQAARSLDQINNQVKSLQNEARMLEGMTTNLRSIDFPQLQRMTSAMQSIDQLMGQAQAVDFRIDGLDQRIGKLFPGELQRALNSDERVANARARLGAARDAYRQAMNLQAQVAQNVGEDAGLLNELAASSQGAAGALQVSQATNQLLALSIKQQLQLQNLLASEFHEAAIDRARREQSAEDGRATTLRFLGGASGN